VRLTPTFDTYPLSARYESMYPSASLTERLALRLAVLVCVDLQRDRQPGVAETICASRAGTPRFVRGHEKVPTSGRV
jgi:hypothetical protein